MTTSPPRRISDSIIPDELVAAVKARNVIPFVGAGFSSGLGSPNWDSLLRSLAEELDVGLTYEEIKAFANDDNLQIAEYLLIKADKRIGPLRHIIEGHLNQKIDPVLSASHVELVNLGALQIYTTNYDDLIERTYRALNVPVAPVALPKDVANSNRDKTQVVKYHGDLRHETTLVLTESAYYRRLDLESPMDIKFRSDIMGRGVLFMGYSFRDINIRLIWFKLMQMMQEIPREDRPTSYIVNIGPNPVQDELLRDVGLRPITLDPQNEFKDKDPSPLVAQFLGRLASLAGDNTIPGTREPMFVSSNLLNSVETTDEISERTRHAPRSFFRAQATRTSYVFLRRRIPQSLRDQAFDKFRDLLSAHLITEQSLQDAIDKMRYFGPSTYITEWVCRTLCGGSDEARRMQERVASASSLPWDLVWSSKVSLEFAKEMVEQLAEENTFTAKGNADSDIAYKCDVVRRLIVGFVEEDPGLTGMASEQLERASTFYPSILEGEIDMGGPPNVSAALIQIQARKESLPKKPEEPLRYALKRH